MSINPAASRQVSDSKLRKQSPYLKRPTLDNSCQVPFWNHAVEYCSEEGKVDGTNIKQVANKAARMFMSLESVQSHETCKQIQAAFQQLAVSVLLALEGCLFCIDLRLTA